MNSPPRITAQEARKIMLSPDPPLLVLAYEDDGKFQDLGLEGAIRFSDFMSRVGRLSKDQGIIFYCA
jgi:hypothetical protein